MVCRLVWVSASKLASSLLVGMAGAKADSMASCLVLCFGAVLAWVMDGQALDGKAWRKYGVYGFMALSRYQTLLVRSDTSHFHLPSDLNGLNSCSPSDKGLLAKRAHLLLSANQTSQPSYLDTV